MKATLAKDLVIGKVYSDIENLDATPAFLRYERKDEVEDPVFFHVGGDEVYGKNCEVPFACHAEPWYELSPSEIEQYLPKEKL